MIENKVVVITGGLGCLGLPLADEIMKRGGIPVITDVLEPAKAGKVLADYSEALEKCLYRKMDISSKKDIDRCIEVVSRRYGRIDALINTAYPRNENYGRRFEQVEYKDFCENVSMHLGGYFLTSQRFALFFKRQGYGNIINISSIYSVIAPRFEIYKNTDMTMPVEYAAIKAGINHISRYIAKYYKGANIRCNTVSLGGIKAHQPRAFLRQYKKYCLNKGMLDVKDAIGVIVFLLSNEAQYINGQNIVVDDGFTL